MLNEQKGKADYSESRKKSCVLRVGKIASGDRGNTYQRNWHSNKESIVSKPINTVLSLRILHFQILESNTLLLMMPIKLQKIWFYLHKLPVLPVLWKYFFPFFFLIYFMKNEIKVFISYTLVSKTIEKQEIIIILLKIWSKHWQEIYIRLALGIKPTECSICN